MNDNGATSISATITSSCKNQNRRSFFTLLRALLCGTTSVQVHSSAGRQVYTVHDRKVGESDIKRDVKCSGGGCRRPSDWGNESGHMKVECSVCSPVWIVFWPELWRLLNSAAPGAGLVEAQLLVRISSLYDVAYHVM